MKTTATKGRKMKVTKYEEGCLFTVESEKSLRYSDLNRFNEVSEIPARTWGKSVLAERNMARGILSIYVNILLPLFMY